MVITETWYNTYYINKLERFKNDVAQNILTRAGPRPDVTTIYTCICCSCRFTIVILFDRQRSSL